MKNTFGSNITVTLFGESHGAEIGAVVDGLAPGIEIDDQYIREQLTLRAHIKSSPRKNIYCEKRGRRIQNNKRCV